MDAPVAVIAWDLLVLGASEGREAERCLQLAGLSRDLLLLGRQLDGVLVAVGDGRGGSRSSVRLRAAAGGLL